MSSGLKLKKKKRRCSPVVPAVLLTAAAAFLIAAVWQLRAPALEETEAFQFDPSVLSSYAGSAAPGGEVPLAEPSAPSGSSSAAEAPISSAAPESSRPAVSENSFGSPVPEQESRVTSAYFDDAVFIGDSITTGISLYDVMSNTTVYASTGVGLTNVLTKEFVKSGDALTTVPDALRASPPGKIYILLGANSLAGNLDDVAATYSHVLDTIRACAPDATLYVQSVFPIYEEVYSVKYNASVTNAVIDAFNEKLLALCGEKQIYYLDLNSFFRDETGGLPAADTSDGLHIRSAQYLDWFDYLKTHAIQE